MQGVRLLTAGINRGSATTTMGSALKENMTDKTETETQTEDVSGLKAKNADLVKRLKTANDKATDLEQRLTDLETAQSDAADTTKTEVEKAEAKLNRTITKLQADLAARDEQLGTLLIDNAVSEAMNTNNVLPQFRKAVEAMLRTGAKIENGEARVGDTTLSDAMATFFKSADAKHFVQAPNNTGAGAAGTNAKASGFNGAPKTREEFDRFNELSIENPTEAKALAKTWGWPELDI